MQITSGFNTNSIAFRGNKKEYRIAEAKAMGLPKDPGSMSDIWYIKNERKNEIEAKYLGISAENFKELCIQNNNYPWEQINKIKREISSAVIKKELGFDLYTMKIDDRRKILDRFASQTEESTSLQFMTELLRDKQIGKDIIEAKLVGDSMGKNFFQVTPENIRDYKAKLYYEGKAFDLSEIKLEEHKEKIDRKFDLIQRKISAEYVGIQKENPSWDEIQETNKKMQDEITRKIYPNGKNSERKLNYFC